MQDRGAHGYCHTQHGPLCLVLYGAGAMAVALGILAGEVGGVLTAAAVAGSLAVFGLACQYLQVEDQGDALSIRFGPLPLFSKTVRYADVLTVEVGRSGMLDGWGIHWSPRGGWLWNLWGRDCVMMQTRQGLLRIGSDDAVSLAAFLRRRIGARADDGPIAAGPA